MKIIILRAGGLNIEIERGRGRKAAERKKRLGGAVW